MQKKKLPRDANALAAQIVAMSTGQAAPNFAGISPQPQGVEREKNPAAVALGRLGGLKGGKVRAKNLTPKERADIARRAAKARWSK